MLTISLGRGIPTLKKAAFAFSPFSVSQHWPNLATLVPEVRVRVGRQSWRISYGRAPSLAAAAAARLLLSAPGSRLCSLSSAHGRAAGEHTGAGEIRTERVSLYCEVNLICLRPCRYCHVNVPDELLRDLLPGPVTLVLQRSEELNKDLNPFTSLVGVRIPNHPFMRDLARACSGPLALTSANISSQGSTLTVLEFQDLWPQLSLVIDGGPIGDIQSPECRLGSTVVDLSVSGKFSIIRPGW
uniref:Threonylcarbamoyl-AMP synthase n=1 Tax=Cyanistes caeruleus TaxID=156563 RepID=A0A8C0UXF8_CYACU